MIKSISIARDSNNIDQIDNYWFNQNKCAGLNGDCYVSNPELNNDQKIVQRTPEEIRFNNFYNLFFIICLFYN